MRLGIDGSLIDEPAIRAGFIGCGTHSFRNLFPVFQFAPVELVATCDLNLDKAKAYASRFGAKIAYDDHRAMLERENLDAVFVCTGYDQDRRPTYPMIVQDIVSAGCHAWIEKPPAACCEDVRAMRQAADTHDRMVMVGFKTMFFPANEKARSLMALPDFGKPAMATLQRPLVVPEAEHLRLYLQERRVKRGVVGFLDHICHPVSLLLYLLGMPRTMYYERTDSGSGHVVFTYDSSMVAALTLPAKAGRDRGYERTQLVSDAGRMIVVENNTRIFSLMPFEYPEGSAYGRLPDYFAAVSPQRATLSWEPEFSLGELYTKGIFALGYYSAINEFAQAIMHKRPLTRGTLEDAMNVTRIFEAFAEGPGQVIRLDTADSPV